MTFPPSITSFTRRSAGRDPHETNPDGSLYIPQVMPWPVYGSMTDLDLRAIYEYRAQFRHFRIIRTLGPEM
jgi:hypothetical protein